MFAIPAILALVAFRHTTPDHLGKVVFFLGTECPKTGLYVSRINSLTKEFGIKGFDFVAKFPQSSDSLQKINNWKSERKLLLACEQDPHAKFALKNHVETVPSVVVLSEKNEVLYRGAIDDNSNVRLVKANYLNDALKEILAGKSVSLKSTSAPGCVISPEPEPQPMVAATYSESIASILNNHCVSCHRPGEIAPFSLIGYENAKNWAPTIAKVVSDKKMPPWKPVPGIGHFLGENRLTETDIELLKTWVEKKAPRGDIKKEPKAPTFPASWSMGEPDITLQMPKPFKISEDGNDEYWHFVLKPNIKDPIFVQAIDVKPGNKKIVHHVVLWIDERGQADKVLRKKGVNGAYLTFGSPGFVPDNALGGWAPGMRPVRLPVDAGILIKPGTNIVLEVHYHKSGKEEVDQTKVGLYISKDPSKVVNKVDIAWLANLGLRIQPNESHQKFTQTIPIPTDVKLYNLMPHMHLLGREMKATLIHPDGSKEPLIHIDDWDFNWQFSYMLAEPKLIKKGSKIQIEAIFDNSQNNPNNPNNPPKEVRWGEQTTDEMMLLVAGISVVKK